MCTLSHPVVASVAQEVRRRERQRAATAMAKAMESAAAEREEAVATARDAVRAEESRAHAAALSHEVEALQAAFEAERDARVAEQGVATGRHAALAEALGAHEAYESKAMAVERLSVASMHLQSAFLHHHGRSPLDTHVLEALDAAAESDALVRAALDSLPPRARTEGVASLRELHQRFNVMRDEARKTLRVPDGGGIWWHAYSSAADKVASVLSSGTVRTHCTWPLSVKKLTRRHPQDEESRTKAKLPAPAGDDHSPLPGAEVHEEDSATFEANRAALESAEAHLDDGDLRAALRDARRLRGWPAMVAGDWISEAAERVALEEAALIIKAQCSLRMMALVPSAGNEEAGVADGMLAEEA